LLKFCTILRVPHRPDLGGELCAVLFHVGMAPQILTVTPYCLRRAKGTIGYPSMSKAARIGELPGEGQGKYCLSAF
jgi:hypothetical protein